MDRPILRAAIYANADVILTGDKDFLEADISCPQILTAAEFLKLKCASRTCHWHLLLMHRSIKGA